MTGYFEEMAKTRLYDPWNGRAPIRFGNEVTLVASIDLGQGEGKTEKDGYERCNLDGAGPPDRRPARAPALRLPQSVQAIGGFLKILVDLQGALECGLRIRQVAGRFIGAAQAVLGRPQTNGVEGRPHPEAPSLIRGDREILNFPRRSSQQCWSGGVN